MSARRSQPKRLSAAWLLTIAIVGIVVLLGVAILGVRSISRRMDAAKMLDRAIEISRQADATVLGVDEVIRGELTPELGAKASALTTSVPEAVTKLEQALELVDSSYRGLNDNERGQAQALREADEARIELLQVARPILAVNVKAAAALPKANEAFTLMVRAERDSDAAVKSYNKLTKAGVRRSLELNRKARSATVKARRLLISAEKAFPAADLGVYVEYADARINVIDVSIASDRAYLAGDPGKANDLSSDFNAAEKRATDAAKELPKSPAELIGKAYDRETGDDLTAYFAVRNEASAADRRLRER